MIDVPRQLTRQQALEVVRPHASAVLFLGLMNLVLSLSALLAGGHTLNSLREMSVLLGDQLLPGLCALLGREVPSQQVQIQALEQFLIAVGLVWVAVSATILYAGWCMRSLELRWLCIAGCLLTMVPLLSPGLGFLLGLFFGRRALVVLYRPSIAQHFA